MLLWGCFSNIQIFDHFYTVMVSRDRLLQQQLDQSSHPSIHWWSHMISCSNRFLDNVFELSLTMHVCTLFSQFQLVHVYRDNVSCALYMVSSLSSVWLSSCMLEIAPSKCGNLLFKPPFLIWFWISNVLDCWYIILWLIFVADWFPCHVFIMYLRYASNACGQVLQNYFINLMPSLKSTYENIKVWTFFLIQNLLRYLMCIT